MHTNPWRFIEQIFVIEPELELQKLFPQTLQAAAITLGALPGGVWFAKGAWGPIKKFFTKTTLTKDLAIHTVGSLALAVAVAYFAYTTTHTYFENQAYATMFKDFIVTWPNNKKQTPPILHEMFEFVNKEYVASASDEYLARAAPNVISRVQQVIYEYYPEKYKHKLLQAHVFPAWLKWTLVALGSAIIVKLATSATKDFLSIVNQTDHPATPQKLLKTKHQGTQVTQKTKIKEVYQPSRKEYVDDDGTNEDEQDESYDEQEDQDDGGQRE